MVIQLVFPVLLYYPELQGLSPTRSAQYETAIPNEVPALYLYDFYRKERRGLAQAPIEREAESYRFPFRAELVPTGFPGVNRRSRGFQKRGKLENCVGVCGYIVGVLFSLGCVVLVLPIS